jgi:hypothetical protein
MVVIVGMLLVFGSMPFWSSASRSSGGLRWSTVSLLSCFPGWRMREMRCSVISSFNKPGSRSDPVVLSHRSGADLKVSLLLPCCLGGRGDEEVKLDSAGSGALKGGAGTAVISWSIYPAALRRLSPSSCWFFWPTGRPLQPWALPVLLVNEWRHGVLNLQACWPRRRPLCFNTGINSCSFPSGSVPGDGAGARALKLPREIGGEEGPDCNPLLLSRVLCVNLEGCSVISDLFEVLNVFCTTTAGN